MIAVAILGGVALGAALLLVVHRERGLQLMALGLLALVLTVVFLVVGAPVPALGMILLGGISTLLLLAPVSQEPRNKDSVEARSRRLSPVALAVEAAGALAVVTVLLFVGTASWSELHSARVQQPSPALVGRHLLLGTGVSVLGLILLTATVVIGMTALVRRDRRELAEDQAEATRRRRAAEQQRRARQREAAREAARQARRRDLR